MITNPAAQEFSLNLQTTMEEDSDGIDKKIPLAVRRVNYTDPDRELDKMFETVKTRVVEVDAKLLEPVDRHPGEFAPRHYRSLSELRHSPTIRRRVLDLMSANQLKDLNVRLAETFARDKEFGSRLKESNFYLGMYPDEEARITNNSSTVFPIQDTVLPGFNGPSSKQQLWADYSDMHRKAWEAGTRNPVGKRIIDIIPQFVLGRGVVGTIRNTTHQKEWDDFYALNKMRWRLRQILRELLMYGEIFNRFFKRPEGIVLRQVDPSTIWDIITDPEDIEKVYYYHQQYTTMYISAVPLPTRLQPTRLVIRQIPAKEIDHFKINSTTSEKRGRSQLYCILGWLLRLKEFANDRVLLNKMRAMFALDVAVDGDAGAVSRIEQQFARPIGAGAVLVHNKATEVEFKNANNNANEAKTDAEMILKIIAVGAGVSEQFLGVSESTTRAGALIQTEPDVKNFETYQEIVEDILHSCYERVCAGKRLSSSRTRMEFTFPALAQEDRSTKIKDIAFAEAMNWFSIERCATMAAKEFGISTYEYKTERAEIERENKDEQVIATGMQQVPKIEQMPPDAPGMGNDMKPGEEVPGPQGPPGLSGQEQPVTQTSGQMGFSAKRLSGRGVADTQATLDRGSFSREKERTSILKRRSAGAPLRASFPQPYGDLARLSSLHTRRQHRIQRLSEALLGAKQARVQKRLTRELDEAKAALAATAKELARLKGQ